MRKLIHLLVIILTLLIAGCGQKNDAVNLSSMLGKNIRGEEIQKWLSKVGSSPEIKRFNGCCLFYSFKQEGIELRFDTNETLTDIFLHSEGAGGYRQYKGELPFKLSFILNCKEIESILGKPSYYSGGEGIMNREALYTAKGIRIQYNTKQTNDLDARIYFIHIDKVL